MPLVVVEWLPLSIAWSLFWWFLVFWLKMMLVFCVVADANSSLAVRIGAVRPAEPTLSTASVSPKCIFLVSWLKAFCSNCPFSIVTKSFAVDMAPSSGPTSIGVISFVEKQVTWFWFLNRNFYFRESFTLFGVNSWHFVKCWLVCEFSFDMNNRLPILYNLRDHFAGLCRFHFP